MVTEQLARTAPRDVPEALVVASVPIAFAAMGLVIRYFAWIEWGGDPGYAAFAQGLCRFDCGWYVRIAEEGYDPWPVSHMGNWAFFPFYPMLVALVRQFVAVPTIELATGMSVAISGLGVMLAWPLFERDWRGYVLFGAFVLAGPFSVYFTTFYTETAFLALTIAVLAQLRRSNYLSAGGLAALLSATRLVGVFAVFAIVARAFEEHRRAGGSVRSFPLAALRRPDLVMAVFAAPVGLFAYMAFLSYRMGDGLAFEHVQRAWGRIFGNPVWFIWAGLSDLPEAGLAPSPAQLMAGAAIAGLALAVLLVKQRRYPEAGFSLPSMVLPLFAGLGSMVRFVSAQAPLMMALASLLGRSRIVFPLALAGCLVGGYYVTQGWLNGYIAII